MKYLKRFLKMIGAMKIRTKLILSYCILLIVPMCLAGIIHYYTAMNMVTKLARNNTFNILKTNNQIIDDMLGKVEQDSLYLVQDNNLFEIFNITGDGENLNVYKIDREVTKIVEKYFPQGESSYSAQLATSYCVFGNNTSLITPNNLIKSHVYATAVKAGGKLQWIPTYDFTEMFQNTDLKDYYSNRYIFSAVRVLNSFFIDNSKLLTLDNKVERPVLIVNFEESFLRKQFEKNITIKEAEFFIITKDGKIVTHNEGKRVGDTDNPSWLAEAAEKGSGASFVNINGKKMILCYDTLKSTGWISAMLVPVVSLMEDFTLIVKTSSIYLTLIFVFLSMVLALIISGRISKPINQLLKVMKKMGEGDFDTRVPVETNDEFGFFSSKFNQMNEKIKKLIDENFIVTIREKESQIMALNLQMNPHFLYNTLNVINCMAIENKDDEVSEMIIKLRDMLIYTVKNKKDMILLRDDLQWLKNYLYILSKRYEDKFTVCFDIDSKIYDTTVPKLFLQPFVENAIIHGFEEVNEGEIILISGNITDGKRVFCVSDNGKGMDDDTVNSVLNEEGSSIGISNVNKRIKLLYGQEYGVTIKSDHESGTDIYVTIPFEEK